MTELDVRDLASESLPEDSFPVSSRMDFRLYLSPTVHQGISRHAKQDTSVEICGVLVGLWHQDANGPYVIVEDFIRCESATSKFAEVTFTHESWSQINQEMDTKFENKRIVGWYHSHPDFGIFLSDRDCFIHQHFFSGAGQVAYVVDPVRDLEGAFAWKENKPSPISHYWIGDTIRTVDASTRNPSAKAADSTAASGQPGVASRGHTLEQVGAYSLATTALACLALFLLGYILSDWRSNWERRAIIEGVVSNYTNLKLVKLGLREDLAEIEKYLGTSVQELQAMPETTEGLSEEEVEELNKVRKLLISNFSAIRKRLREVGVRYGYSDDERRVLGNLVEQLKEEQLKLMKERKKQENEEKVEDAPIANDEKSDKSKEKTPEDVENSEQRDQDRRNDEAEGNG